MGPKASKFKAIDARYDTYEEFVDSLRASRCGGAHTRLEASQLIIAIDVSRHNAARGAAPSLHEARGAAPSPYAELLQAVGPVVDFFDADSIIPTFCFGFGDADALRPLDAARPGGFLFTRGVEAAYRACIARHLPHGGGDVSFVPPLRHAVEEARRTGEYHVLIILSPCKLSRRGREETAKMLIAATRVPLSVVCVGIGDGPFDGMDEFDDRLTKRRFDNFNFFDFFAYKKQLEREGTAPREAPLRYAVRMLAEVPEQYRLIRELGYVRSPRN